MHGYDADVASSAEQAIDVLAADGHQFDVVLVDVDLPGKDGMELLRDVRKLDPDAKPVLLTAVERERVWKATRTGVPYLRKPIDFNRLLGILGESATVH
jgi:DNA-binding response OmpR family regulator